MMYEENFTFSVEMGSTTTVQVATLSNRPPRSNFRPIHAVITATAGYVPATSTHVGYHVPAALQCIFRAPAEGDFIGASNLRTLGVNPTRITLRYPATGGWWPYNNTPSDAVLDISAVCMGRAGNSESAYVRGTVQMFIALQPEVIVSTCPQHLGPMVAEGSATQDGMSSPEHE